MNRLRAVPALEEEEAAKRHDQPRVSEIDRVREREHDALVVPPVHLIVHDPQHHADGDGTQRGCCNPGDQRSIEGPSAQRGGTDGSLIHPTPLEGPGRRGPGHTHRVPRAHSHHETATPATPLASVMFRAFPPAAISDRASMDARTTIAEAKSSAIVMRRR